MTLFFNPVETGKNFVKGNVFLTSFNKLFGISISSTKHYARFTMSCLPIVGGCSTGETVTVRGSWQAVGMGPCTGMTGYQREITK